MDKTLRQKQLDRSGVGYVGALLSLENFKAATRRAGDEKYDFVVTSPRQNTLRFSVRTVAEEGKIDFQMSENDSVGGKLNHFYFFVRLGNSRTSADYWVVPSLRVNEILKKYHELWLKEQIEKDQPQGKHKAWVFLVEISKKMKKFYPATGNVEIKSFYKNIEQLLA